MKKFLLSATLLVATFSFGQVIWSENFETGTNFSIDPLTGWEYSDIDGSTTYGSAEYNFPNEGYTGVGIIFNAASTDVTPTPPAGYNAYQGSKGLYFFDATTGPAWNNDWAVMPQITLGTGSSIKFWAKSITAQWGLEKFNIAVSTTNTAPTSFTNLNLTVEEAPTTWTEYEYDLSAYDGQTVYIAIHFISQDAFFMQTDQFEIISTLSTESFDSAAQTYVYPSPATNELNLKLGNGFNAENVNVTITNMLGQVALTAKANNNSVDVSSLNQGVYSIEINDGVNKTSRKFTKK
jgi:hypothetical protein